MAAKEIEAAQKALRKLDYDSEDDDDELITEVPTLPESTTQQSLSPQRTESQPQSVSIVSSSSSFDPYARGNNTNESLSQSIQPGRDSALVDDASVHSVSFDGSPDTKVNRSSVPGVAGFLEMEGEPPRNIPPPTNMTNEPITTSSGLLLTHRRPSPSARRPKLPPAAQAPPQPQSAQPRINTIFDKSDPHLRNGRGFRSTQRQFFEVEHGFFGWNSAASNTSSSYRGKHSMPMVHARRFLSYVRIWMVISACFLLLATGVLYHSFSSSTPESVVEKEGASSVDGSKTSSQQTSSAASSFVNIQGDQIILVPVDNIAELSQQRMEQNQQQQPPQGIGYHTHHYQANSHHQGHGGRRLLHGLRDEFEQWITHHGKQYRSIEEKEKRFSIWSQNHQRTLEKNEKHGPCKMTKQAVFGSNHLKDLSPEEFKSMYLTGYKPPHHDQMEANVRKMNPGVRSLPNRHGKTLKPGIHGAKMHASIKQRLLQQRPITMRNPNCKFYDISCLLRWLWNTAGVQFGAVIGTMEPKYDASAFPISVDWRDYGIVTEIRSQGDCGACWAITAVETVESAHALATGNLYDLSEAEIITCDDSCEMCSGGWPQNAFEWVMDHGGLPLYNSMPYDSTTLLSMTNGIEGTSATWTENSVKGYRNQVCPADDSGSKSGDSEDSYWSDGVANTNYGDYSDKGRYGNIKGYGYATDRCVCYSDGSGCDCDDQDEELAVANIATYGPAVICIEASLWQDYTGGIITSDLGCGSEFLDMNHCAQVVGYAFTEDGDGDGGNDAQDSKSGSNDEKNAKRSGYWVVRNQWGGYWGMNGYAYVAMGDNTCGILNDMTQAYLED